MPQDRTASSGRSGHEGSTGPASGPGLASGVTTDPAIAELLRELGREQRRTRRLVVAAVAATGLAVVGLGLANQRGAKADLTASGVQPAGVAADGWAIVPGEGFWWVVERNGAANVVSYPSRTNRRDDLNTP